MRATITVILLILTSFGLQAAVMYKIYCNGNLLDNAVYVAKTQVGLKEKTGNNDGSHIEGYLKAVGLNPKGRYPYCAAGLYWCFAEASKITGEPIPIKRTASANGIYDDAVKRGQKSNDLPKKGDLLVWKLVNSYNGHIEMIIKPVGNGIYKTIGFNTSSASSGNQREGQGNYYKYRSIYDPIGRLNVRGIVGFKRWL